MSKIVTLAALVSLACLASGCASTRSHVVGRTEGDAHRRADALCRTQDKRARVQEWIGNSLAFECVDSAGVASPPVVGLTDGPL
jgi:hypothetical protein